MLDIFDNQMFIYALVGVSLIVALITLPANIGNLVKKAFGGLWIVTAIFGFYTLYTELMKKMTTPAATMQWSIILVVFSIVLVGFAIFGYYGLTGAYDNSDQD